MGSKRVNHEVAGSEAMDVWEAWLPKEAKQTNRDDAFYGMKEEYQTIMNDCANLKDIKNRSAVTS